MSATPIDAGDFILLHRRGIIPWLARKLSGSHWDGAVPIGKDEHDKLVAIVPVLGIIMAIPIGEFIWYNKGQMEFVGTGLANGPRFVANSYLNSKIGRKGWLLSGVDMVAVMLVCAGYPGLDVLAVQYARDLAAIFGVEPL